MKLRRYEVIVDGVGGYYFRGGSRGQARYNAWLIYRDAYPCTFRQFMSRSSVRAASAAAGKE